MNESVKTQVNTESTVFIQSRVGVFVVVVVVFFDIGRSDRSTVRREKQGL
jgi:hypothetical protein